MYFDNELIMQMLIGRVFDIPIATPSHGQTTMARKKIFPGSKINDHKCKQNDPAKFFKTCPLTFPK